MIVCSCSVLTKASIVVTAEKLSSEETTRPLTPGRLFRAMDTRPQCGACFPLIRSVIAEAGFAFTCPEPLASEAEADQELERADPVDIYARGGAT